MGTSGARRHRGGGGELHDAVERGDVAEAVRLLDAGCDINAFDELGKAALHGAVRRENLAMADLLIKRGADVNARHEPTAGDTPPGEAAGNCSLAMAKLLVGAGADPTTRGWMRLNALDRAKARGRASEVYQWLREVAERQAAPRRPTL